MEQVALNTIIGVMMAIFPGFLFRKCYYSGEFTKQFNQSNELDKLLWNVFFSGISIGITFLSIYFFRSVSGLEVLESLSYDTIQQIVMPISVNKIPEKDLIYKTYKDLLLIIGLIYFFSCFFGIVLHWLIRSLKLDIHFPLLRFKNYWHYYIHGGKILYSNPSNKRPAFTVADVLCEIGSETKLYKGILSQYTINKDDSNLENIFLTNASALKQVKDANGNTIEVKSREIPGAIFCIPYKTVLNINLVYVYRDNYSQSYLKLYIAALNMLFFLGLTLLIASLWFDLSSFGVVGFWGKFHYFFWTFLGLSSLRQLAYKKDRNRFEWIGQILIVITSILWLLNFNDIVDLWIAISALIFALVMVIIFPTKTQTSGN